MTIEIIALLLDEISNGDKERHRNGEITNNSLTLVA